jgi:UDP-N-acetylglucosamine:LPS N-acetylglucosamine transferase
MTTAESQAASLPVVMFDVIPGQEARNCSYLLKEEAAVWGVSPAEVARHVDHLLSDDRRLEDMSDKAGAAAKPRAAWEIATSVLQRIGIEPLREEASSAPPARRPAALSRAPRGPRVDPAC